MDKLVIPEWATHVADKGLAIVFFQKHRIGIADAIERADQTTTALSIEEKK